MGSGESTTRKVSFGVDDEDRVRILRGVKLSEDVLQRMRGVANIAPDRTSSPASSPQTNTASSHSASSGSQSQQGPQQRAQPSSHSSKSASFSKEDQRRYEHQQKLLKEEWAKMAQREMEAAKEEMAKATSRERQQTRLEAERTKQLSADEIESMVQQLQKKDSQLKALDAFYKEQLAQLEKRNLERYQQSKEQFHQAASKTEENVSPDKLDFPQKSGVDTEIHGVYKETDPDNRD
ncbi:MICOS complex subunit mic25a isoform X3 [Neolamprologus brichardi]|uniref:MICOS complex subunit mic25a isoform X3 n=1 Tax=Neolamprologus brichardi TaxID=32507 RepID=UPI001643EC69|nr:MICOS complex subunit mic25a isoform X3 [Neolamprologus brichardi]